MPKYNVKKAKRQLAKVNARTDSPSREECERLYPDLIAYIKDKVSLVDLIKSYGYEVTPLSPDAPNAFIAHGACPDCGKDIIIKE